MTHVQIKMVKMKEKMNENEGKGAGSVDISDGLGGKKFEMHKK